MFIRLNETLIFLKRINGISENVIDFNSSGSNSSFRFSFSGEDEFDSLIRNKENLSQVNVLKRKKKQKKRRNYARGNDRILVDITHCNVNFVF